MQLLTALGVALYSIGPSLGSNAVWKRVNQIAEGLEDTDYQLRAQWGLWTVCVTGGKHRPGLALAHAFARLAKEGCDPEGLLVGERLVGISHHFLGEQTIALRYLEGMVNRAPVGNPADILRFQFDQSVAGRAFLGRTLWLKGLTDRAMREVAQSVADAQSVGHSLSLCYTLGQGACLVSLFAGDWTATEHYATLLLDQATRHGLALWETMGRCFQGMVAMRHGKSEAGLALLQQAVTDLNNAGYALYHTVATAELANALGRTGQSDRGLSVIDKALAQSIANDERWCMAELLRIKAEILLLQTTPASVALAEDHLQQSLDWARRSEALAWELRTANSLCRLLKTQNREAEGRNLLAPIHERFVEGFDTLDMRTATLLLER